jgi:hypothetical protein
LIASVHRLLPIAGLAILFQIHPAPPFAPISAAAAASYYIRADGNDANTGLSNNAAGAWRTISRANSRLIAGDVVSVISLNPADSLSSSNAISPAADGDSLRAITYLGNILSPETLPVTGLSIHRKYIRVLGFRNPQASDFSPGGTAHPVGSVIQNCILNQAVSFEWAERCKVNNCVMRLSAYDASTGNSPAAINLSNGGLANHQCWRDTISNNVILITPINAQARSIHFTGYTYGCLLDHNRITLGFDLAGASSSGPPSGLSFQQSYDCTFRDNHFTYTTANNSGNGPYTVFIGRSESFGHYFLRDTFDIALTGTAYPTIMYVGQGSTYSCPPETPPVYNCNRNSSRYTFDGCLFRSRNCEYSWALDSVSVRNNTFITQDFPLRIDGASNSNIWDHNTFVSLTSGLPALRVTQSVSGLTLTNNIFYKTASSSTAALDASSGASGIRSDRNLFANWGYGSSPGDRSIGWGGGYSKPGPGTSWAGAANNNDANSGYAGPPPGWGPVAFADTTSLVRFDASLTAGSLAAIGRGAGGTNLGGGQMAVVDVVPPAAIVNLAASMISDHTVHLTWTSPGDDGTIGVAAAYDVRYSTLPITDLNFASATPVTGVPAPAYAGTAQGVDVTGLTAGTTYYFAIKTRDEANNWSPVAVLLAPTTALDGVSPAKVGDLRNGP